MPDGKKINELTAASSIADTDVLALENSTGTGTKKATAAQLAEYAKSKGANVDATLTRAGVPADAKAAGDGIAESKSAITDITGDTQIPLVANKYIDLSGSSVTMSGGVPQFSGSSATYSVGYMECSPGDEFCVSGTGGSQTRLWGFVDSSGNILEIANTSVSANRLLLTAPTNAAYIIIHTRTNDKSYNVNHGSLLKDYVTSLGKVYDYYPQPIERAEFTQLNNLLIGSSALLERNNLYGFYFPCLPNHKYHIIRNADLRFAVTYTTETPKAGVATHNNQSHNITSGTVDSNELDVLTIETGADAKYIYVYYANMNADSYIEDAETQYASIKVCGPALALKRSFVTPQMFCIEPGDRQDKTLLFNLMIGYLAEHTDIKTIYFPCGVYWGQLNITNTALRKIVIHGDGLNTELCGTTAHPIPMLFNGINYFTVHDMTIRAGNARLGTLTLNDFLAKTWKGIVASNSPYGHIYNVYVNSLDDCITIDNGSYRTVIDHVICGNLVENGAFANINNTDPLDPNNPGKNTTYAQNSFIALMPRIHKSIAIKLNQSNECTLSDIYLNRCGRGILASFGTSGAKIHNVEAELIAGYALKATQGGYTISNFRVDSAGQYNEEAAVYVGTTLTGDYQYGNFTDIVNMTVLQSASGGIVLMDKLTYASMRNCTFMNNSSWYTSFNYYHLHENEDRSEWNPESWEPLPEILIKPDVSYNIIDAVINADFQSRKSGEWCGYSNGVKFEDKNGVYTQRINDIKVIFGYDAEDPTGESLPTSIKNNISPYNVAPDENRIIWNCTEIRTITA